MMIHISFTAKNCSFVSALMRIGFLTFLAQVEHNFHCAFELLLYFISISLEKYTVSLGQKYNLLLDVCFQYV